MVAYDLPIQPTSFVGRADELAEIIGLLDNPDCCLVTLVGAGGIGKTRLAVEVGTNLGQRKELALEAAFVPSAVYFVPLQPINSPELILTALAESVGLQFYAGGDPRDQLIDYLRPKTLLLILDNFEHLLQGVDLIADLLANAPTLKLLVTSRESLNLREEWLYPVGGMRLPEQGDLGDVGSYSAIQLFMQSARRVRPDFSLSAEQQAVLNICRLVEGMPLALEMTAAWLRRLPADEIVQQLEHGLDILESPARNVPERHRSIRAVFEHSWNLLTETEQNVFLKLSVFRGGFRREAAEAVAGATLGILSTLVDKSLIAIDADGRYSLHELLRQYAEERLGQVSEAIQQTQAAHAAYYMDFLTARADAIMRYASLVANEEIAAELKNVRSALDWVLEHKLVNRYKVSLYILMQFYFFRCLFEEGEEVSRRILEMARAGRSYVLLSRMLMAHGWFVELRAQDYPRALSLLEEGMEIGCRLHPMLCMNGLLRLSDVSVQMGEYKKAEQLAQESLDLALQDSRLREMLTFIYAQLGYVKYLLGDYYAAKDLLHEAIRIAEEYDSPTGVADGKNNLGEIKLALQMYLDAKQIFAENVAYSREKGYLKGVVLALIGAADAARALDELSDARQHLSEALTTAVKSNQVPYILSALSVVAALLMQTEARKQAAQIVAFVLDHHAATPETKRYAGRLLAQLESELPSEALATAAEYGRTFDMERTVQTLLDCELSENPTENRQGGAGNGSGPLTEREVEILRLTADGLSNREIADRLFLAVGTVKWYLSEIYSKLNVTSRTQAIAYARALNLMD